MGDRLRGGPPEANHPAFPVRQGGGQLLQRADSTQRRPTVEQSSIAELGHIPVLPTETLEALAPAPGQTLIDCTAGLGGHAASVAEILGPAGKVVLNDLDAGNLTRAAERVRATLRPDDPDSAGVLPINGGFTHLPRILADRGLSGDMLLADLGFASTQVDDPARGLSFRQEGPLDMRLDPTSPVTAAELVNTLPERELADLIWRFGEDRNARRIARKVVEARGEGPIETTSRLSEIVRSACPPSRGTPSRIDPATRTFQALRIAVNDEIGSLESRLASGTRAARDVARGEESWLKPGARIVFISFHSLEDRPVKRAFASLCEQDLAGAITRKPVCASDAERERNPRARSAKLRAVRLGGG
ncbi:MAG: 16S rRNA (cytosine(1402)-N(4))-methyltransferase RsmH [Phycisphaerales bacterium JB059]